MNTATYQLIGLSKPKSATLQFIGTDKEIFWATLDMPQERFDALWGYVKGFWDTPKYCKCEFDSLDSDGVPINCVVKEIFE